MKPETLAKKRTAFLKETINHYNLSNRGIYGNGYHCSYSAGCAIGRKIKSKELKGEFDNYANTSVSNDLIFNQLPETLKELGSKFLESIQTLHDNMAYWDDKGLSDIGHITVKTICNRFDLNPKDLK